MKINRTGVTRLVIELKEVVIKIPNFTCQWDHFLLGLIGNIRESNTYKWNENRELLCPVLWCSWGGWMLIMKKAKVCTWDDVIDYTPWTSKDLGGDDKPNNYGYLNNKLVKIDYAQFG